MEAERLNANLLILAHHIAGSVGNGSIQTAVSRCYASAAHHASLAGKM